MYGNKVWVQQIQCAARTFFAQWALLIFCSIFLQYIDSGEGDRQIDNSFLILFSSYYDGVERKWPFSSFLFIFSSLLIKIALLLFHYCQLLSFNVRDEWLTREEKVSILRRRLSYNVPCARCTIYYRRIWGAIRLNEW